MGLVLSDNEEDLDEEEESLHEPFKKSFCNMSKEPQHSSRLRIPSEGVSETQEFDSTHFESATERYTDGLRTNEAIPSSPSILKRKRSLEMSESKARVNTSFSHFYPPLF